MLIVSDTHKRYIPTTDKTAPIQTITETFLLKKIPIIGTKIMYNVVKNPAFPTDVCWIPNCCKLDATRPLVYDPRHWGAVLRRRGGHWPSAANRWRFADIPLRNAVFRLRRCGLA